MKQLILFISILFSLLKPVQGQNKAKYDPSKIQKTWALKVNVLSPFLATLNISAEYLPLKRWSLQNGINYTHAVFNNEERTYAALNGFQYVLDIRKYAKPDNRWNGWYAAGFARYSQFTYQNYKQDSLTNNQVVKYTQQMKGMSLGFTFGYQRSYQNRFLLDAFFGLNFSIPMYYHCNLSEEKMKEIKVKSFESNPYTSGTGLRLGLKVGYLF